MVCFIFSVIVTLFCLVSYSCIPFPNKIFVFSSSGQLVPCPGSPKVPSFPSLPDMSPKKVSAAHNVYVSPLRSSKVFVFLFITVSSLDELKKSQS